MLLTVLCRSCVGAVLWSCCGCVALCVVVVLWLCFGCFLGVKGLKCCRCVEGVKWLCCVVVAFRELCLCCSCVKLVICCCVVVALLWRLKWKIRQAQWKGKLKLTLYVLLQIKP